MNKNIVIKAENISKQYRLGQVGTGTISHDLNRFWHKIRGLEDPYLKIGETNDRTSKGDSDYVWSLRDINFEIEQGDAVGIIGRNGAGKSTLLKLLSRVTKPTTGNIYTKGRIASLLEVGTGFHPEMTGRENIFLNGAILGMTRKEITRKFDEIVDFSGVERYVDTPVKRYSSGMYVRLAFAVAAHLESEILIVDEVLAVGDAEFQKKCLGKMGDVSKGEGRTVLFVSHNMAAVKKLCNRGMLLKNGLVHGQGEIEEVLKLYESDFISNERETELFFEKQEEKEMQINKVSLVNFAQNNIIINKNLSFEIEIDVRKSIPNAYVTIDIKDINDELIYWTADYYTQRFIKNENGSFKLLCKLPKGILSNGFYTASFAISSPTKGAIHYEQNKIIKFEINDNDHFLYKEYGINYPGKSSIESEWTTEKI